MKESELKNIVASEIVNLRKSKGYTASELALKANIAASTLSRYENGYGSIDLAIIEKIVSACNQEIYIFFSNCIAKLQQNNL